MGWEKPDCELVANAKNLWYPFLSPANIQNLRIKELEPNPFFFDEKIEYIIFDTFFNVNRVLAAHTNSSQPSQEPLKEPVKYILRRRI